MCLFLYLAKALFGCGFGKTQFQIVDGGGGYGWHLRAGKDKTMWHDWQLRASGNGTACAPYLENKSNVQAQLKQVSLFG